LRPYGCYSVADMLLTDAHRITPAESCVEKHSQPDTLARP
jgi:hypothetical protein